MTWPVSPLGSVLRNIEAGTSPKALARPAAVGEYGVLKVSAVTSGTFRSSENKALDEGLDLTGVPTVRAGDLLVSRANTTELVGAVAIPTDDHPNLILSDKILRLVPIPERADSRYLYYALGRPAARGHIESHATGTSGSMRNISQDNLRATPVPLPPLPEQRRIAAILDEADALRRKRREAVVLLDDLLRATFLDMFGDPVSNPRRWRAVPLDDLAEVQGGLQVTAQRTEPLEVPYLRVANVYRERLDLREIKSIRVTPAERERVRLRFGDILVVEGHGNPDEVGRAAVWDRPGEMLHQNHLIRVRADPACLDPWYLSAFLNSPGGRRQMVRAGKTTSGLNTISTGNVKAMTVLLPPLGAQVHWSRFVRACASEGQRTSAHTERLDSLFSSLLHRAFTGDLGGARAS